MMSGLPWHGSSEAASQYLRSNAATLYGPSSTPWLASWTANRQRRLPLPGSAQSFRMRWTTPLNWGCSIATRSDQSNGLRRSRRADQLILERWSILRRQGICSLWWVKCPGSGPRMVAFFAVMYFSALRPGEAVNLRRSQLVLPRSGWGELHLEESSPYAGASWTDHGKDRDHRQLKHRAIGEARPAPCPPALTTILHHHLDTHGTDAEGRLFWAQRGGDLPAVTYQTMWKKVRERAFGKEAAKRSQLAKRPYDLRHAAVSTWLASGVEAPRVAMWAGHSVDVLLRVYAKFLDGQEEVARRQIEAALGS
jgi:integrase